MRVLITGATGFIGNNVIKNLLKSYNHEVIATSIDPIEKVKNFSWSKSVEYIPLDLNEPVDNCFKFFKEPDTLIHLSWEGLPNYKELYHFERNIISNYIFIKNMIINGLKDLNIIGTCAEYGLIEGCVSEDLPSNPVTPYALGKDTLRKFIEQLNKMFDFNFKWIRLFFMYGKHQYPNSILPLLDKALNNNEEVFNMSGGEQLRDYLPVKKVAEYINKISLQNEILGIINCCNGKPISIKELVVNHMKKRGKTIKLNLGYYPYIDYEPMSFWGDNTKLKLILNKYDENNSK
ncbi:MAG: NAD-dependent epimerase/dehydratase family protein [Promethearchaeota archaeon]